MTREEKSLEIEKEMQTSGEPNPFAIIDDIYDDFESRTCENCSRVNDPCQIALVAFYDEGENLPDFGCNKFIRKEEV